MPRILPGRRPSNLGVTDGQLRPAGNKPNCVSTQDERSKHKIAPIAFSGAAGAAIQRIEEALKAEFGAEIVTRKDDYLHAECSTKLMGFVDDVEAYASNGQIQLRSASRVGYSDWGVNRKRIEQLRAAVQAGGAL